MEGRTPARAAMWQTHLGFSFSKMLHYAKKQMQVLMNNNCQL
jgi:hypothetical protein